MEKHVSKVLTIPDLDPALIDELERVAKRLVWKGSVLLLKDVVATP